MIRRFLLLSVSIVFAALVLAGCSKPPSAAPTGSAPATSAATTTKSDDHEHLKSAHGGKMFAFGAHQFHGEALIDKDGVLRFFTFDKDEEKILEVAAEPLTAYATAEGERNPTSIVFRPEPQKGDALGMTSQFIAHLPKELTGKTLDVVIQNFRVGGNRFRVPFQVGDGSGHVAMPGKVADDEERKLYLQPGGLYTSADIEANGKVTASEKFKGLKPAHDAQPKSGEKICPISETKANQQFVWVIGGKKYEFCCPPCVDEFLTRAKEKPESIRPPEEYRKK